MLFFLSTPYNIYPECIQPFWISWELASQSWCNLATQTEATLLHVQERVPAHAIKWDSSEYMTAIFMVNIYQILLEYWTLIHWNYSKIKVFSKDYSISKAQRKFCYLCFKIDCESVKCDPYFGMSLTSRVSENVECVQVAIKGNLWLTVEG